ncbi:MAG: 16S rRNA (cytosine(967)-C(5))-methyltransferase RsmB [Clostridium sp.]|nr:16S rRNA (cytosine(967)-C(5))-methyltransferase RsmB [Clostridium sp.]
MKVDKPRKTALEILYDIDKKGAYSNISLNRILSTRELRDIDRAFITDIVYGTLNKRLTIDYLIEQYSRIKIKRLSPWVLNILRMGIYQLVFMDKVPASAACNESVKLAKKFGHSASSRYVNAVLRNIARNIADLPYPTKEGDITKYLSIMHSYPEWMVQRWLKRFGEKFTEEFLKAGNEVPPFTIRVNTLKVSKGDLAVLLADNGFRVKDGNYINEALIIENPTAIKDINGFSKGYFQVQDESSMLVSRVLDPKPGQLVIDVCGAPGGKSTHIAQLMNNEGLVVSRDIYEHKTELIDKACSRLGINIIKTEIFDAAISDEALTGKADRVLVDAPCTGFGIIRRKPDIKWTRKSDDKEKLAGIQNKILYAASKYVRNGGVLVYSTCTVEPEENEGIVKKFIHNNEDFHLEDVSSYISEGFKNYNPDSGCMQLYPNVHGTDGFFIAKMVRKD